MVCGFVEVKLQEQQLLLLHMELEIVSSRASSMTSICFLIKNHPKFSLEICCCKEIHTTKEVFE